MVGKTCPHCGASLPEAASFCPRCARDVHIRQAPRAPSRRWQRRLRRFGVLAALVLLAAMLYDRENPALSGVLETRDGACRLRLARALPPRELWFERVWRAERENDGEQ